MVLRFAAAPRRPKKTRNAARTLADRTRAAFFARLQAQALGRDGFDFVAYVDFCYELALGCASTAWNFGNLQVHTGCWRCTRSALRGSMGADPQR